MPKMPAQTLPKAPYFEKAPTLGGTLLKPTSPIQVQNGSDIIRV